MNLETFKLKFEEMCKNPKYSNGATSMEIFVYLNNPNITMGQIEGYLFTLCASNHCHPVIVVDGIPKYIYDPQPAPSSESSSTSSVIDAIVESLSSPNVQSMIVKLAPILKESYMNHEKETEKAKQAQAAKEDKEHQEVMSVLQEILQQQKLMTDLAIKNVSQPSPPAAPTVAPSSPPVIKVKSFTGSEEYYSLDMTKMTCTCPNFIHVQCKLNPPGKCKHLTVALENGVGKMT